MADDSVYPLLVDHAEARLIHRLRDWDDENEDTPERTQKLTIAGTVQLKVSVGDRDLDDTYPVPAIALIFGCAEVGLKIQEKLLSKEWIDGAGAHSREPSVEAQSHVDEGPSQLVNGDVPEETISWKKFRSEALPSYIQIVTFTIPETNLTDDRRKDLEEQFPDVTITVKEAPIFELEKDAASKDDALEANIRKQYPQATVVTAMDLPTGPRALRQIAPVSGDVETQLQDFATFMTDYPPDGTFDVNVRHDQVWGALPFSRKMDIARARAIQVGRYCLMNLQYYYLNLVNLHILARKICYSKLEFATLLQFQFTNFEQEDNLPDINKPVIKAFEHLPVDTPLCRWIAIVFSYVWNTVEDGDYEAFLQKNSGLDPVALCRFLYAVAYVRDPHTKGGNSAVMQQWCSVHDHVAGSAEDKRCMAAERACKSKLMATVNSPNKAHNGSKRPFDGSSGLKQGKKFKHNNGYPHDSRPTSISSAAKEKDMERDGDDTTDDTKYIGKDFADDMSIVSRSHGDADNIPAVPTVGTNDPPRRKRGRPRKKNLVDAASDSNAQLPTGSRMLSGLAAMISSEHLGSLPFNSDFHLSKALDEEDTESTRVSTAERLPRSEEPTSERRTYAKAHPPGFFRQHLPKSQFLTQCGVFKED
ncbi:hypothetical protein PMIN01_13284 [Paraphaeosphaeria minitans]|uniref:Uncharacterized protein n=1 Tax=Paraphaeosphaeria minitans TaxID=565426 RepID=A0A9P6KJZ2_9PLEO|nr:hypothetical protein PMIN01_13284 [Paraphaeosphaeria minitans]